MSKTSQNKTLRRQRDELTLALAAEKKKNAFLLHEIKMLINDLDNTDLALSNKPSILKEQAH